MLAVLAGGVGAARFLRGLVQIVPTDEIVVVVNTGDDDVFHGLHVSPDIDTITYTLGNGINPDTGWGLAGDTFRVLGALERYGAPTWFRLGDADLATHLYRTERLASGSTLSEVTADIARAWGLGFTVVPMSDDPIATRLSTPDGEELRMQEWFVQLRAGPEVTAVRFEGAATARAAPGVIEALREAEAIVVCPSNPIISIGPILAVPGVLEALQARRARVVGVSPIIAGATVKGPADRLLRSLGHEVSCVGVARLFSAWCSTLVIDEADEARAPQVAAVGTSAVVAPTLMTGPAEAAALARVVLDAVGIAHT